MAIEELFNGQLSFQTLTLKSSYMFVGLMLIVA